MQNDFLSLSVGVFHIRQIPREDISYMACVICKRCFDWWQGMLGYKRLPDTKGMFLIGWEKRDAKGRMLSLGRGSSVEVDIAVVR